MMLSVSEEYAKEVRQIGKTQVNTAQLCKIFYSLETHADELVSAKVIEIIRNAPFTLLNGPNWTLGPAR